MFNKVLKLHNNNYNIFFVNALNNINYFSNEYLLINFNRSYYWLQKNIKKLNQKCRNYVNSIKNMWREREVSLLL